MTNDQIAQLAFGRILKMGARPEQSGDGAEYERCRRLILDALDPDMDLQRATIARQHDAQRDRWKGAQGQI